MYSFTIKHIEASWCEHAPPVSSVIIGSNKGKAPVRCRAIIWIPADIFVFVTWGIKFSKLEKNIHKKAFEKMTSGIVCVTKQPFWLGLNVLFALHDEYIDNHMPSKQQCQSKQSWSYKRAHHYWMFTGCHHVSRPCPALTSCIYTVESGLCYSRCPIIDYIYWHAYCVPYGIWYR